MKKLIYRSLYIIMPFVFWTCVKCLIYGIFDEILLSGLFYRIFKAVAYITAIIIGIFFADLLNKTKDY